MPTLPFHKVASAPGFTGGRKMLQKSNYRIRLIDSDNHARGYGVPFVSKTIILMLLKISQCLNVQAFVYMHVLTSTNALTTQKHRCL